MADLFEYYNIGDDGSRNAFDNDWLAQTFTPAIAHKITSVKLLLQKDGNPRTLTVSIKATSDGMPTGDDLCVGTTSGTTLPSWPSAAVWREITLGAGANLNVDTKYAIVVRALDGDIANYAMWRLDSSSPTYTRGHSYTSTNSGSSWLQKTGEDFMFEDWGEAIVVGWQGKISGVTNPAKIMGVDVANIHSVKGVLSA